MLGVLCGLVGILIVADPWSSGLVVRSIGFACLFVASVLLIPGTAKTARDSLPASFRTISIRTFGAVLLDVVFLIVVALTFTVHKNTLATQSKVLSLAHAIDPTQAVAEITSFLGMFAFLTFLMLLALIITHGLTRIGIWMLLLKTKRPPVFKTLAWNALWVVCWSGALLLALFGMKPGLAPYGTTLVVALYLFVTPSWHAALVNQQSYNGFFRRLVRFIPALCVGAVVLSLVSVLLQYINLWLGSPVTTTGILVATFVLVLGWFRHLFVCWQR